MPGGPLQLLTQLLVPRTMQHALPVALIVSQLAAIRWRAVGAVSSSARSMSGSPHLPRRLP
eukprot:1547989-Alexandrium_andersonii.AAC.1